MGSKGWCVAAAALAAAQPVAAAGLYDGHRIDQRSGAFAGATLRVSLDRTRERISPARLGFGVSRIHLRSDSPARTDRIQTPGVELTLAASRPRLLIGGERPDAVQRRLGMSSTATTLLVVGGLAVAAIAIVQLTDGNDDGPCPIQGPC